MAEITVVPVAGGTVALALVAGRVREIRTGNDASFTAITEGGDQYQGGGDVFLLVKNTHATDPFEVTRLWQRAPADPGRIHDDVVVCDAQEVTILPSVASRWFNDSNGKVQLRYPTGSGSYLSIVALRFGFAY